MTSERFRHFTLANNHQLTVFMTLDKETNTIGMGFVIYEKKNNFRGGERKFYNTVAKTRTLSEFTLAKDEPLISDYITLRSLWLVLSSRVVTYYHDDDIRNSVALAVQEVTSNVFRRLKVAPFII